MEKPETYTCPPARDRDKDERWHVTTQPGKEDLPALQDELRELEVRRDNLPEDDADHRATLLRIGALQQQIGNIAERHERE